VLKSGRGDYLMKRVKKRLNWRKRPLKKFRKRYADQLKNPKLFCSGKI